MTVGESLLAVASEIPDALDQLLGPPFVPGTEHAWEVFHELIADRPTGTSIGRITHDTIRAYQENTGDVLTAMDVAYLRAIDEAFVDELTARSAPKSEGAP